MLLLPLVTAALVAQSLSITAAVAPRVRKAALAFIFITHRQLTEMTWILIGGSGHW